MPHLRDDVTAKMEVSKQKRDLRTITRSLRFTDAEWDSIAAKLAGRDFSATARALLFGAEIPEPRIKVRREVQRRRMSEAEAATVRQLAWIGNNLNQIARAVHIQGSAAGVIGALVSLEREVRRLADAR